MSMRYGKAVFSDGHEAYLVYTDSPGWAFRALFASPEKALEWREHDFPVLRRAEGQAVELAKASEEPVHILADMDFPETPRLWFYTTASRSQMVITGPTSREESESLLEQGEAIFSQEFFEAWSKDCVASNKIERYDSLTHARKEFIDDITSWWRDVRFKTKGERGEKNVFDEDPLFVTMAQLIQNPRLATKSNADLKCSTQEVAKLATQWWDEFYGFDSDMNIFDSAPGFIERAKRLIRRSNTCDPEP